MAPSHARFERVARRLRDPGVTIRYRMTNTAMPSGINAQAVYNAKSGTVNDRIWGGADNDTFWGRDGDDVGSVITNYRVNAYRVAADGSTTFLSQTLFDASSTTRVIALTAGNCPFDVVAINALGDRVPSARSNTMVAR